MIKDTKTLEEFKENWKEYFVVNIQKIKLRYYRGEGEIVARFYIPVKWNLLTGHLECWILPLVFCSGFRTIYPM